MSAMDALEGLLVAAVISSIAILVGVLAPTVAFLVIALVSLKGTRSSDRPAILRALVPLSYRRDQCATRLDWRKVTAGDPVIRLSAHGKAKPKALATSG
jgi:hypothetical protein